MQRRLRSTVWLGCASKPLRSTAPGQALQPAITYAEEGFPRAEKNARYWESKKLLAQPGYAQTYIPGGVKPGLGDTFKNPAVGESLRQIAAHGREAYYDGKLTELMVKFLNSQGGTHTLEVFREFQPEWVEPISTTYRGWTVYELPPNGQGIAALSMLNTMFTVGQGEVVMHDTRRGINFAGADPRSDGAAIPESPALH